MGSSTQTGTTSQQTSPWAPQQPYIKQAFGYAQNAYNKASQAQAPTDFTAQMTPDQLATFKQMIGYGGNTTLPTTQGTTGSDVLGAGASGATGALNALGAFDPSKWNSMDGTINGAKAYAAGIDIPGAVRNAMLAGTQEARDVTNPMIDNTAASTGNTNSSRTGLAEGLVDRGLAEQASGLSANMQDNAFSTGANIAQGTGATNLGAALSALTSSGALGNSLVSGGSGLIDNSINNTGNLFSLAGAGGAGEQQGTQDTLTNLLQRYQSAVSSPYDAVNNYYGIVGGNNWGSNSTGTSTSTATPSAFQTIGGLAFGMGNLFKLSDARLKTDIARVGATDDGIPIYRYRYVGEDRFEIGFLAHEIEKLNPAAVATYKGVKFVNYDEATKHLIG